MTALEQQVAADPQRAAVALHNLHSAIEGLLSAADAIEAKEAQAAATAFATLHITLSEQRFPALNHDPKQSANDRRPEVIL
ncbi:hypothetical protein [Salinisphaera hydrothermalis]|uniref:Uncharacterized protein n=1 Tax=Salinisphaera hydrothermalis (strain C41B8) TaxID=1304275 RepID=A0A084INR5_SALHC|nr:hypothetical protein [Salinisphaera hydrothermalis]KEZ78349.1 hypothetical protein C41B8_05588 [Salinisphaera hydrothermalis C41B8]